MILSNAVKVVILSEKQVFSYSNIKQLLNEVE